MTLSLGHLRLLQSGSEVSSPRAIKETAQVFVGKIFSTMVKDAFEDMTDEEERGFAKDMFEDLLADQLGEKIAASNAGSALVGMIEQQMLPLHLKSRAPSFVQANAGFKVGAAMSPSAYKRTDWQGGPGGQTGPQVGIVPAPKNKTHMNMGA